MQFSQLFAVAALAASAVAQNILAFTQTPGAVQAGVPATIRWTGGSSGPVTISLRKGSPTDLKTVAVLTGMPAPFSSALAAMRITSERGD